VTVPKLTGEFLRHHCDRRQSNSITELQGRPQNRGCDDFPMQILGTWSHVRARQGHGSTSSLTGNLQLCPVDKTRT
jgi:hypothetical protein